MPECILISPLDGQTCDRAKSGQHGANISREVTGVDEAALEPWLERMGLGALWQEIKAPV